MRKVIGIGETVLDIIFKNGQPTAAVPGGSVFNSIISLARAGADVSFISEVGNDHVGDIIISFMKENGVSARHLNVYSDGKSSISLAFLDENHDAHYLFYKDYPNTRLDIDFPPIAPNDIVLFGSYFALNPVLRSRMVEFLDYARENGAILFYDLNFRANHKNEIVKLVPSIIDNFEYADIVRGSRDDFNILYGLTDVDEIYRSKIEYYCPRFILTRGGDSVLLRTKSLKKEYPLEKVEVVSTVGAGDNFNAGVVLGLLRQELVREELDDMSEAAWDKIIHTGLGFAAQACTTIDNYVSREWAQNVK